MIVAFTRSRDIGSVLIRLATWSRWSHVAVVEEACIEDIDIHSTVIDSTFLNGGVKRRSVYDLLHKATEWAYVEIDTPDDEQAYKLLESQLGKKYDVTGILGIAFRRKWEQDDKWFCNELFEWVLLKLGMPRFREDVWRLTPQHSWMVNTGTTPVIRSKKAGYTV